MRLNNTYIFRLALRNVFRNKRRTIISLLAVLFGCNAVVLYGGYVSFVFERMRESAIHRDYGHIQIHAEGFSQHGVTEPAAYSLDSSAMQKIQDLCDADSRIDFVTPRLPFTGLVSTGPVTTTLVGTGVDTIKEAELGLTVKVTEGNNLSENGAGEILLGKGLAQALGVTVGDELTILGSTFDGMMNGLSVNVKGILYTGVKAFDDTVGQITIGDAKLFLDTDKIQYAVVVLKDTDDTWDVAKDLMAGMKDAGLKVEMKTWEDLAVFYQQVKSQLMTQFKMIAVIISVIVVLSIANTMIMAVYERVREIGTLRAMGTRQHDVRKMFVMEGLVIGLIGGFAGVILAVTVKYGIDAVGGIPAPIPPGMTEAYNAHVELVPVMMVAGFIMGLGTTLLSSAYPAFRASRFPVAEALRHL